MHHEIALQTYQMQYSVSIAGPTFCSYVAVAQIGPTGLDLGCCQIESRTDVFEKYTEYMKYRWKDWITGEREKG